MTNSIKNLHTSLEVLTKANQEQAAALSLMREQDERNNCIACGEPISHWEETELTDTELILTYRCSCGCYAEQHYSLTYTGTCEIE